MERFSLWTAKIHNLCIGSMDDVIQLVTLFVLSEIRGSERGGPVHSSRELKIKIHGSRELQ